MRRLCSLKEGWIRPSEVAGEKQITALLWKMALFFSFAVLFVVFPALHCQSGDTLTVSPTVRELFMKDGVMQYLNCSSTSLKKDAKLEWTLPKDTLRIEKIEAKKSIGGSLNLEHNIMIPSFSSQYSGKYTCSLMLNNVAETTYDITLTAIKENKTEPRFYMGNDTATLSCSISIPGSSSRKIEGPIWFKNGTKVSELKDADRFESSLENKTLVISETTRQDAGLYVAQFEIDGSEKYDCQVAYIAGPLVLDFEKSKNLIQEDNMELRCQVKGYPYAVVTWFKDDQKLNVSKDNDRIQQTPLDGYQNARLTIKNVEFSDAGEYRCEAYTESLNETNAKTIVVRVKDKLAALWPFLGIVCEVFILCTIIFIYEKKRNRQAEQADNDAQEADQPEKKGNVRNRRNQK
ncbi:neuroplastin isoform X2 [Aplysia californica]|uniref:Neuroplastin isoform X2 n=1 Tax=Aplysia californica TaxID=6500 RepID=A0ABM0K9P0_APLCA|nr:neuroplastin isoform X2 [Aplysia californica]